VYGLDIIPGVGYRDNHAYDTAGGADPEGMYMVASGTHANGTCCFDFGNAETSSTDKGPGHMDALNFGTHCYTNYGATCTTNGPWFQADLEDGLFQNRGTSTITNPPLNSNFVTGMLKNNGTDTFALKGGDASGNGGLNTTYDGPLPSVTTDRGGYIPMRKEGAVTLGVGGDNSNGGIGSFFEGAMTIGYPTDDAESLVYQNTVQAKYTGNSDGSDNTNLTSQVAGPAVVHSAGATGAGKSGYTSVFTVNAKDGHLEETYLPYMGASWAKQDLSATGGDLPGTPPVKPDTRPVAVVRCGFTGVFTVDAANNHLQETYLQAIGGPWVTQDITDKYHTPPTKVTPTAVVHFAGATGASAACGYSSVYTVDASNGHLDETYLTATGQPWIYQDLSADKNALTPNVQPGTSPVALYHDGYTSVFTVGAATHDIYETYLSNIGNTWATHDLTRMAAGPKTTTTLTAVFHDGYTSVYAADDPLHHLFELYLPAIGDQWKSQDLTAGDPHAPAVAPGTAPVALFHTGYTSVYTVDAQSMHVEETYLSNIGNTWATQDLNKYGTPPTTETPFVVVHPDENGALTRTSVFTVDQFDNDLQDTALVAIGDRWTTQDLTYETHGPPLMPTAPATATYSVANDGYTYVFKVTNGDLTVSYLSANGAAWGTLDLTKADQAPKPMAYTWPVAVAWDGHVTVFSVGDAHGHVWATTLPANGGTGWTGTDVTDQTNGPATGVTPTAVFHGGNLSVFTVDDNGTSAGPGDLEETYLPQDSSTWQTQDLSKTYVAPSVAPETSPVALYHDGYTSVFTAAYGGVGAGSNDLEETWLTARGDKWQSHDLTKLSNGTPMAPDATPTADYHSGYTSVYSPDFGGDSSGNSDVRTTFLTAIGDDWQTQDLTQQYGAPKMPTYQIIRSPFAPSPITKSLITHIAAVYHTGYNSIYYFDPSGDLIETYLPAMGDNWQHQDLTEAASIPKAHTINYPSALVHYDVNGGLTWTTVYTYNADDSLQATYLQRIGGGWVTKGLPS
jgi:hypothetical protein